MGIPGDIFLLRCSLGSWSLNSELTFVVRRRLWRRRRRLRVSGYTNCFACKQKAADTRTHILGSRQKGPAKGKISDHCVLFQFQFQPPFSREAGFEISPTQHTHRRIEREEIVMKISRLRTLFKPHLVAAKPTVSPAFTFTIAFATFTTLLVLLLLLLLLDLLLRPNLSGNL